MIKSGFPVSGLPDGGESGQVPMMTETGIEWEDLFQAEYELDESDGKYVKRYHDYSAKSANAEQD